MDWIERYVKEVGRRLPRKLAPDVEAELRSSLEDALEDRLEAGAEGSEEAACLAVLREMGPPEKVAASYLPERYLIGPALFPYFVLTLKTVLAVVLTLVAIGVVLAQLRVGSDAQSLARLMARLVGSTLDSAIGVVGMVVIVFALVERFGGPRTRAQDKAWDPRSLPPGEDPERIGRTGLIIGTAAALFGLVVLNVYPERFASTLSLDGSVWQIGLLGPGFWRYLPLLDLFFGMTVALNLVVLREGRWRALTRWLDLSCTLVFLFWLFRVFVDGPITVPSPDELMELGISAEGASRYLDRVVPILARGTQALGAVLMILSGVNAISELRKAIRATLGR